MFKRLILMAVLATAVAVLPASVWADTVTYSTTGMFNTSTSGCSVTGSGFSIQCGGVEVLSFAGTSASMTLNAGDILNGSLGTFDVYSGALSTFNTAGTTFDLTINQTNPSAGTGTLTSTLTGNIYSDGTSNVWITFNSPFSQTLGTVTYDITNDLNAKNAFSLAGATIAAGNFTSTTFNAQISEPVPAPEPASLLLLGTGCLGVFGFRRRKRLA